MKIRIIQIFLVVWGMGVWGWAAPMRLAALNVELGIGNSTTAAFAAVARDLERIGPDVVALQELVSDYQNVQSLGSRLGLPYFYALNSSSQTVGLLSRYPLRSAEWVNTGGPRLVPLFRPDLPNLSDDPWIAVVHLKCCGSAGGAEQQARAAELYNLRANLVSRGITAASQVVILGDFNLVSDSDASYLTWPTFAPASADDYFPSEGIFKLSLLHADGNSSYTWRGSTSFPPRAMDHIMASGPIRDRFPQSEIYDFAKDMAGLAGRPKFGDLPATGSVYSSDHLPVFADLVLRDTGDGFPSDTIAPSLGWNISSQTLIFLNQTVSSVTSDVRAVDSLDPAPVVTCYPLNPTYTSAGTKKITYMARDRHGNISTMDRTVTVAAWGQGGLTHNLQWPPTIQIPVNGQGTVYAQIYIPGWTETLGKVAPNVRCWIGVHTQNSDPSTWPGAAWKEASLNGSQGIGTGADEYAVSLVASDTGPGTYYYAARWQINGGAYGYGGIASAGGGGAWDGTTYAAGVLTVGSTFAGWSGGATLNSENLYKYAIGGATSLTSADGEASVVGGDNETLTLTAIVRTDDNSLTIVGEASANLMTGWGSEVVSVANTADQSGVPTGCSRKVFSVSRGADKSKFLRLRVMK